MIAHRVIKHRQQVVIYIAVESQFLFIIVDVCRGIRDSRQVGGPLGCSDCHCDHPHRSDSCFCHAFIVMSLVSISANFFLCWRGSLLGRPKRRSARSEKEGSERRGARDARCVATHDCVSLRTVCLCGHKLLRITPNVRRRVALLRIITARY